MLPLFPAFEKLCIEHKEPIQEITKQYPPFSDFNFFSMWCYNTDGNCQVSVLNNSLIAKMKDYTSNKYFFTFLGDHDAEDVIEKLLKLAKTEKNTDRTLRMIPSINIERNENISRTFALQEDIDNFDYILSIEELAKLEGNKYYPHRNLVRRFAKQYPEHEKVVLDLCNKAVQKDILELFLSWEHEKGLKRKDSINELIALKRGLEAAKHFDLYGLGIYFNNKLVAFSIEEKVSDDYVVAHFGKATKQYLGIYDYIETESAKYYHSKNLKYLNYEQDLGIPGLRKAKLLWHPVKFLKKYIIKEHG